MRRFSYVSNRIIIKYILIIKTHIREERATKQKLFGWLGWVVVASQAEKSWVELQEAQQIHACEYTFLSTFTQKPWEELFRRMKSLFLLRFPNFLYCLEIALHLYVYSSRAKLSYNISSDNKYIDIISPREIFCVCVHVT